MSAPGIECARRPKPSSLHTPPTGQPPTASRKPAADSELVSPSHRLSILSNGCCGKIATTGGCMSLPAGKLPPELLAAFLAGLPDPGPRVIVGAAIGEDAAVL